MGESEPIQEKCTFHLECQRSKSFKLIYNLFWTICLLLCTSHAIYCRNHPDFGMQEVNWLSNQ